MIPTRTVRSKLIDDFSIITIPPNVWFGFQGLCEPDSLIMNCASIEHDPNEVERLSGKNEKN